MSRAWDPSENKQNALHKEVLVSAQHTVSFQVIVRDDLVVPVMCPSHWDAADTSMLVRLCCAQHCSSLMHSEKIKFLPVV